MRLGQLFATLMGETRGDSPESPRVFERLRYDPNQVCNVYEGRLVYVARGSGPSDAGAELEASSTAIAWWTWESR